MKMGRPRKYREKLAEQICNELIAGKSLMKICAQEGMPSRSTVLSWLTLYPTFRTMYQFARESQADLMDDLILDTANKCSESDYQSSRVKINAYQWRASRLKPKQYGDRINLDTNIQVTRIIVHDDPPILDAITTPALPAPVFDDEPEKTPDPV
jgi:hypothetical protein